MVTKSCTSFDWGKDGKVTAVVWQETLCDPILNVISGRGVMILITNCYIRVYVFLLYFISDDGKVEIMWLVSLDKYCIIIPRIFHK